MLQNYMPAASDMTGISRRVWRNWFADEYGLTWTNGTNYHFTLWAQLPPSVKKNWDTNPQQAIKDGLGDLLDPSPAGLLLLRGMFDLMES